MLIKDNIIINLQELITLVITINHRILDIVTKTRKRLDFLYRQRIPKVGTSVTEKRMPYGTV